VADINCLPLWTDAWIADTHHLTRHEKGLYLDLLVLMWRSPRGQVPRDVKWLCSKLQIRADEFSMLEKIIKEFCQAVGHNRKMLTQKRLQKERDYVLSVKKARRDGAKLAWTNRLSGSKTTISYEARLMHPHPNPKGKKERNLESTSELGPGRINGPVNGRHYRAKPHHQQSSKKGRIWFDVGTMEFDAHAADYRNAHYGLEPPLSWNGAGAWFNIKGEK
jgi:uncharacterized protein YdaU (DUF1376 family)